uniref:Serpentine receptor class gamma n=1 Tax=Meloidogyne javanica TaxID=6303 RepID=A0A915LTV9_MELJA
MQVYSKILLQTCFVDIVGICMFVASQPVNTWARDSFGVTNELSDFTSNYASALTIINYIIIIFCGISIQIRVYRHCKGVEMTQLRNMNKQLSIVLGAQLLSYNIIFINGGLGSLVPVLNPIVS